MPISFQKWASIQCYCCQSVRIFILFRLRLIWHQNFAPHISLSSLRCSSFSWRQGSRFVFWLSGTSTPQSNPPPRSGNWTLNSVYVGHERSRQTAHSEFCGQEFIVTCNSGLICRPPISGLKIELVELCHSPLSLSLLCLLSYWQSVSLIHVCRWQIRHRC